MQLLGKYSPSAGKAVAEPHLLPAALTPAAFNEVAEVWATQLLGLASLGLGLDAPPARPCYGAVGIGVYVLPLDTAVQDQSKATSTEEWEGLVERLVAMTGRCAVRPSAAGAAGLMNAWAEAAAPALVASVARGSLLKLLEKNASTHQSTMLGASTPHTDPPPLPSPVQVGAALALTHGVDDPPAATSIDRTSEQMEAIVAGLVQLACQLPLSTGALDAVANLVQCKTADMDFAKTYLAKGSQLREQVCSLEYRIECNIFFRQQAAPHNSVLRTNRREQPHLGEG